jgi:hypothetical protein
VGRRIHAGIFARVGEVGKGVMRWRGQVGGGREEGRLGQWRLPGGEQAEGIREAFVGPCGMGGRLFGLAPSLVLWSGARLLPAGRAAAWSEALRHVPPRYLPQRIAGICSPARLALERVGGEEVGSAGQTFAVFGQSLPRVGREVFATPEGSDRAGK